MFEVRVVLVGGDVQLFESCAEPVVVDGFLVVPIQAEFSDLVAFNVNHVLSFGTKKMK